MLLITRADVEEIFRRDRSGFFDALLERVESGYREVASGQAQGHPRIYLRTKDDALRRPPGLFTMSALLPEAGRMGTRLLALGGPGPGGDGLLILFDQRTLACLAIINDQAIHNYRTGIGAALATRMFARPDARTIAVLGSGGIAEGTLAMVAHVRPSAVDVRVFSPTPSHRERFAEMMAGKTGRRVRAASSAAEAVSGADIVITATDADKPVVPDEALDPGTHVNVMARNELEQRTFERIRIVLGTSHDIYAALDPPWTQPLPAASIAGDMGEAVTGRIPVRSSPSDVTAFVSAGSLAMWDVVTASAVYDTTVRLGLGTEVSLEAMTGFRGGK